MEIVAIFVHKRPKDGLFCYKMAQQWPKMAKNGPPFEFFFMVLPVL
jgi:hypothetical protein